MHIALVHDAVIPPRTYGGTERVIDWLARALCVLGHKITLVARPGSRLASGTVIPCKDHDSWEKLIPADSDIIHLWATPQKIPKKPFLITIGGNGKPGEVFHPNTIFVSSKHAENHGSHHFVYNGIDPDDYISNPERGDYAVFLAKASWKVKNLSGAISVARRAGIKLEVLGSRNWPLGLHRAFSRSFAGIGGVTYHGMADDAKKRVVLQRALALIFPVRWHEPFGLGLTEALASGCPVLGTPYGSLPEIVTSEVGFLSANGADLAATLCDLSRFSRDKCRARVLNGLTHLDMARSYLSYYRNVLDCGQLSSTRDAPSKKPPGTNASFLADELMPWQDA